MHLTFIYSLLGFPASCGVHQLSLISESAVSPGPADCCVERQGVHPRVSGRRMYGCEVQAPIGVPQLKEPNNK